MPASSPRRLNVAPTVEVHAAIAPAFAALDDAQIAWCVLRGVGELNRVDGDVDLLVSHSDASRLRDVLAAPGLLHPQRSWGRRPHRFFFGDALHDGSRVKLDVVTQLAFGRFGELPTAAAEPLLAARRRVGGLPVPADADAFWALLAHAVLDRGHIRSERAIELQALLPAARGAQSVLRDVLERACPPGWDAVRIQETVVAGAWGEVSALGPELQRRWPGTTRLSRSATVTARRALRRAQRVQQRGSIARKRAARSTG